MENWNRCGRKNNHCDWQSEIELDEPQTIYVALPCRRDKRNGAGLRSQYREAHRVPGHRSSGKQIFVDAIAPATSIHAVRHEERQPRKEHYPIERSHPRSLLSEATWLRLTMPDVTCG